MKIRVRMGLVASLGLLVVSGDRWTTAHGQLVANPTNAQVTDPYWQANKGAFQDVRLAPTGEWGEVINVTSRWIVVQDQQGRQYPIASDRVRQFLIRWASSAASITPASMLEVTGYDGGSNSILADHVDQYEGDAQSLVTPIVTNNYNNYGFNYNYGFSATLSPIDVPAMNDFQASYFIQPFGFANALPMHVVGRAVSNDPIQVTGNGQNWYTVQPGQNGLNVTQITKGTNSYARRGDIVYIVSENLSPKSLDVSQLVLYKKIQLREFQP